MADWRTLSFQGYTVIARVAAVCVWLSPPIVIRAPDAPGSVICSSITRKRSLLSAESAVLRAASTSFRMRAASAEAVDDPRTGALAAVAFALPIVVICTADPPKFYEHELTKVNCGEVPEKPRNLMIDKGPTGSFPPALR